MADQDKPTPDQADTTPPDDALQCRFGCGRTVGYLLRSNPNATHCPLCGTQLPKRTAPAAPSTEAPP